MKINTIFENELFAFKYDNEGQHELDRLMELWTDPEYISNFLETHKSDIPKGEDQTKLAVKLLKNASKILELIYDICNKKDLHLEEFFAPLDNQASGFSELSRQKGKLKKTRTYLRILALRIDKNCFVITGGAIKFTHLMKDRDHTYNELKKINRCKDYLKSNGVFDSDSFYEFIIDVE
ncbi:hypothetical protein [Membranihabitans marinus]|uniref:hypothetical protein n=1 Tax=Membranihabitans marinus TaxID=1227546 RepID=UPI001F3654B5|nr:hypothetical protein [Membranihabitans marinus]